MLTMDLVRGEVTGVKDYFNTRLAAMDKAQSLFEMNLMRVPSDTEKYIAQLKELFLEHFKALDNAIDNLRDLSWERFASVQTQFTERDERVKQTATDTKTSIDAALQAAEKAIDKQNISTFAANGKAEQNFTKQIDGLTTLLQAETRTLHEKVNETKQSLLLIEGRTAGLSTAQIAQQGLQSTQQGAQAITQAGSSYTLACIGFAVMSLISIAGLLVNVMLRR